VQILLLNDPPYGTERAYNGLRPALEASQVVDGAHRGSLAELTAWTPAADRVVTF
jgi:sulfur relay (sulfurtransferase) complex TusBCD TusD component (DsrE family)